MKKLIIIFTLLFITTPLWSHSIKFVAMDRYYDKVVPIDSILVHDMNTGEEKLYASDSIYFETVSSVDIESQSNSLHIYPNPVEDILNVNSKSSDIIISDISGRVHFKSSTAISGNLTLNVAGLPQGLYAIRSGHQTQTFIKNTSSNGQDISIISSSYLPNPLVKENEVQSQFDYRFTIYSEGFKPKNYYTKAITKDTVVELDMDAISLSLYGKKIRFEINLKDVNVGYEYRAHNSQGEEKGEVKIEDRVMFYEDTLIFRNNSIEMIKAKGNSSDGIYHSYNLKFSIDTVNKTVSNLSYSRNYRDMGSSNYATFYMDELELSFAFDSSQKYFENNKTFLKVYLNKVVFSFKYYKEYVYQNYCPGHYTYTKFGTFDKANSYIKIEFLD